MVKISRKNAQATISLLVMCALFLAPVSVRPCETTESPEQTCCCCPCCQDTESSPVEPQGEKKDCPCEISEANPGESSPAVVSSHRHGGVEILLVASSTQGETDDYQPPFIAQLSASFCPPGRGQPLYILHSSFLI